MMSLLSAQNEVLKELKDQISHINYRLETQQITIDRHEKVGGCSTKGLSTRSDGNEQKSFTDQHETILFIATPATRKRTSSTK